VIEHLEMISEWSIQIWLALTRIVILIRCHHLLREFFFSSHTLKLAQPRAACASSRARHSLKRWRDHFLKVESSASQFARVDDHWHRSLRVFSVLDWIPLSARCLILLSSAVAFVRHGWACERCIIVRKTSCEAACEFSYTILSACNALDAATNLGPC